MRNIYLPLLRDQGPGSRAGMLNGLAVTLSMTLLFRPEWEAITSLHVVLVRVFVCQMMFAYKPARPKSMEPQPGPLIIGCARGRFLFAT